jgi:hypothetical protein
MTSKLFRSVHLIIGIVTILVFALTGQYMDKYLDHLKGLEDFSRLSFRTGHIYILLSGITLTMMGLHFQFFENILLKILQLMGSILMVASIILFIVSFFKELPTDVVELSLRRMAIYFIFAGALFHFVSKSANTILIR